MTSAEKCLIISGIMGDGSDWMNDEAKVEQVEMVSRAFGWCNQNDTTKKHEEIIELYKQGVPTKEIIYLVDLSVSAVNYVIRKYRLNQRKEVACG